MKAEDPTYPRTLADYPTRYKVKDMDKETITLIQDQDSVNYLNELFEEEYIFFFIKPVEGCLDQVYGSYSPFHHQNVYYVGELSW